MVELYRAMFLRRVFLLFPHRKYFLHPFYACIHTDMEYLFANSSSRTLTTKFRAKDNKQHCKYFFTFSLYTISHRF